jgi:hypothetical protein
LQIPRSEHQANCQIIGKLRSDQYSNPAAPGAATNSGAPAGGPRPIPRGNAFSFYYKSFQNCAIFLKKEPKQILLLLMLILILL